MAENNLATLIRGVCHDAGKMKGIEFHLPAARVMEAPGRWEAGYKLRRQGHSTVILSYWFSVDMLLREEVILPWALPSRIPVSTAAIRIGRRRLRAVFSQANSAARASIAQ